MITVEGGTIRVLIGRELMEKGLWQNSHLQDDASLRQFKVLESPSSDTKT